MLAIRIEEDKFADLFPVLSADRLEPVDDNVQITLIAVTSLKRIQLVEHLQRVSADRCTSTRQAWLPWWVSFAFLPQLAVGVVLFCPAAI